jgi:cytochrome c oxidase subunit IV
MSARQTSPARLWRKAGLVWLGLTALLAATLTGAYMPIGAWKLPLALFIAALKAALVVTVFMELGKAGGAARIAALAGALWVALLLSLSMSDVTTRQMLETGFGALQEEGVGE